MHIQIVGLNHKSAPIEVRERISFSSSNLISGLSLFRDYDAIEENLILSTCNRVEIYAVVSDIQEGFASMQKFISDFHRAEPASFKKYLYSFSGIDALRHLFRVVSSLDSMILGETQIFAQIKEAYQVARQAGCIGRIFTEVFEEAVKVGKMVRTKTQIGKGAVSIGSAGIELTKKVFGNFEDKSVLIIGAGKISQLVLKCLISRGINMVLVSNRTYEKAQELARQFNGEAIKFESLFDYMKDIDIVINSTSTPHIIVNKSPVQKIMKLRRHKPLFFLDLAVPRNIDHEVNNIDNVYLYNIDDIARVKDANINERLLEAKKAENIVNERANFVINNLSGSINEYPRVLNAAP